MVRNFLIPPTITAGVAAVGLGICAAFRLVPHCEELYLAAAVILIAAEVALIPLLLVRGKTTLEVSQAGLISTVLHMFLSAGMAYGIMQVHHPRQAFIYWLCAFYWTTLAGVCRVLIVAIKNAPVPPSMAGSGVTGKSEQ